MSSSQLLFDLRWNRPVVRFDTGDADLLLRITAPDAPSSVNDRAPIDVAFVIDRSGSMSGSTIEEAKQGVRVAIDHLDQRDRAAVVIYDDRIDVIHPLSPVTSSARHAINSSLDFVDARGSTNLGEGWLVGCQQIASGVSDDRQRRLQRTILLTDGQANVGIVDPAQLSHHAANLRQRGVTTTTLGFGEAFDEQLLSAMAEAGGGNFEFIRSQSQLVPFFSRELGDMLNAAAIGMTLRLTLPEGMRGELISTLPCRRKGKTFEITVGDLPAGESVDVLMHVTTTRGSIGDPLPVSVSARWSDRVADDEASWNGVTTALSRAAESTVTNAEIDVDVAEKAALQRASSAQREALQLDRAGRYAESRQSMRDSGAALLAAPQTDRVFQELRFAQTLADVPMDEMYSEDAHKRTTSRVSRMGRGRSDREESLSEE